MNKWKGYRIKTAKDEERDDVVENNEDDEIIIELPI